MKKVIGIVLVVLIFITSCGMQNNGGESLTYPQTEASGTAATETKVSANQDTTTTAEPLAEELPEEPDKSDLPNKAEYLNHEDVQQKYPDKIVLNWGIVDFWGTHNTMRIAKINEYLDSLGKKYAVCFIPFEECADGAATYSDGVNNVISTGEVFDIIYGWGYNFMVSSGLYASINSYLETTEVGQKLYELMPKNYWKACSFGKEIYGIGNPKDVLSANYCYYYNAEMVKKYNYDMNKSPLEQIDILKKIKEENPGTAVFATSSIEGYIKPYSTARNLEHPLYWDDDAKEEKCALDNEIYMKEARTKYELKSLGLATIIDNGFFNKNFFIFASSTEDADESGLYDVTIIDKTYSGCYKKTFSNGYRLNNIYGVNGIAAMSEHKDEAFDMLALCYSDPYLNNLMCYGVEGEDYTLEDGKASESHVNMATWFFANCLICHPSKSQTADYAQIIRERIDSASYDEAILFQPDTSKYSDKLVNNSGKEKSLSRVMIEFRKAISDTSVDFNETVSEYRQKLMDMGLQEIIDDINEQYKAWEESMK